MKKKFNEIYNLKEKIEKEEENRNIKNENNKEKEIKKEVEIKTNMIKEDEENIKYKNEINLIYKTNKKGKQKIFGKEFVKYNNKNMELIIL